MVDRDWLGEPIQASEEITELKFTVRSSTSVTSHFKSDD